MIRTVLVCAALAFAGTALAADFAGTWNLTAIIGGNPSAIRCTLLQNGATLSGACKPAQFEPSSVTGSVAGSRAKWSYDVVFNGAQNHVEYEAVLGPDGTLAGTLRLGPMPVPFTAARE